MLHHLGSLQCSCTVTGVSGGATDPRTRAVAVVQEELPLALGEALDATFGEDPTVYVLRSIDCHVTARLDRRPDRVIAYQLAAAIAAAIRAHPRDDHELVRFADDASHLVSFLRDALAGTAEGKWYYRRFRDISHLPTEDLVRAAVHDSGVDRTQLVRTLHERGLLAEVLAYLDERAIGALWRDDESSPATAEIEAIVRTAADLVDVLGWWHAGRDDDASWQRRYLRSAPRAPDWREPASVADAVLAVIRWLRNDGLLCERLPDAIDAAALMPRFDWLDGGRLVDGLGALRAARSAPGRAPTPQQVALRADIELAIERCRDRLDPAKSAANALVVWAELLAHAPRWRDVPGAPSMVADVTARTVDSWPAPASPSVSGMPTAAAGIFLLVRAAHDLRLAAGVASAGLPGPTVLAALARRWAGPAVPDDDPSLVAFAGVSDYPVTIAAVDERAVERWQVSTLATLVGQRLVSADRIRLRRLPHGHDAIAVIAGDPSDRLWATAALDGDGTGRRRVVERWTSVSGGELDVEDIPCDLVDAGRDALLDALATLVHAHAGVPHVDLALDTIAIAVVRAWARWLRGFSAATVPYLFDTFIRRSGWLLADGDELIVQLEARPHDIALQVAGYLEPFEAHHQGEWRRLRFEIVT
jgi:hypothetical protein